MVNDQDVRELHAYVSSISGSSGCSGSDGEFRPGLEWAPVRSESDSGATDIESPCENSENEVSSVDGGDSEPEEPAFEEEGSWYDPEEAGGTEKATPCYVDAEMQTDGVVPLTAAEIHQLRAQLQGTMGHIGQAGVGSKKMEDQRRKRDKFKVPKEHPVFDGDPEKLEIFIMDMQMTHEEWIMGKRANKHNPGFIMKLLPYFKPNTPVALWFKMYATERRMQKQFMSWNMLVSDLRKEYGVYDQPEVLFENFWELKQTGSVQSYIARKKAAALLAKEHLTESLTKFGFIRGLKGPIRNYVKLQKPRTVERAQKYAIAFENSSGRSRRSITMDHDDDGENVSPKSSGGRSEKGNRKRNRSDEGGMSDKQRKALKTLRQMREHKCFGCGEEGHRKDSCKADRKVKENFQANIKALKETINGDK